MSGQLFAGFLPSNLICECAQWWDMNEEFEHWCPVENDENFQMHPRAKVVHFDALRRCVVVYYR